jgi:probable type I restriction-modification system
MNRYDNYKDSGLTWIQEIPAEWVLSKVNAVFDERREKVSDQEFEALSVTKNGIFKQLDSVAKTNDGDNRKKVLVNDFVINSRSDRKGSSGLSEFEGSVSLINLVLKIKKDYPRYIHYLLKSTPFQEEFYRNGKGIVADLWSTNFQSMKSIVLPIPPINEQEQIANYLDWKINEIDRLIQVEKEKIKELKRLTLNIIAEFVLKGINTLNYKKSNIKWIDNIPSHWNEISIRGCVNIIRGNSSFTKDDLKNQGEYVGLQYGKVYKTEIIDSKFNFYVSDKFYKTSQVVTRNDIIIVSTSETVEDLGHTSFYDRDDIGLIGGEQILLRPLNNIDAKYLLYLSKIFRHQLQLCATGIKVYRFKINDLKQLYIPLPPIEEQENIVSNIESKLKQLDERVKNHYDLIKELELLKQSLISEVVTGKMDVRNVVIPEYEKVTLLDDETEEFDEMEGIEDGD